MELVNGQDELADGVLHQPVTKAGNDPTTHLYYVIDAVVRLL